MSEMLGYEELSELTGRSVGALRVARSEGRLPEPDAPGPRWRRESLAGLLKEGAPVPAGGPSAVAVARAPGSWPYPDTPVPSAGLHAAPAASKPGFTGEDAEDRRRRSMTLEQVLACPHPADDRKVLPYMAMCLRCGRRQEGRDRWAGAGYAGWDPSKLAACPHPTSERVQHAWGGQCGVCGRLLR